MNNIDQMGLYEVCMMLGCRKRIVTLSIASHTNISDPIGYATVIPDNELSQIFAFCTETEPSSLLDDLMIGMRMRKQYYPEAFHIYCKINNLSYDNPDIFTDEDRARGELMYSEILRRLGNLS